MSNDILPRLLWAVLIIAFGLGLYRLATRAVLARARSAGRGGLPLQAGVPSILYFTTPDCAPCRTVQRPALQTVQQRLGERLRVIEINAYDQPDLAKQWGVLSVPTTFILDANGAPHHVNHGATSADQLMKQLNEVM